MNEIEGLEFTMIELHITYVDINMCGQGGVKKSVNGQMSFLTFSKIISNIFI